MSLAKIQAVFENMHECDAWTLQLLRIKTSKRSGTIYAGTSIKLTPSGRLSDFVVEISERYVKGEGGELNTFAQVLDYDGTANVDTIYKLKADNPLIMNEYNNFLDAVAKPEEEADPLKQMAQAYVIQGSVISSGEEISIKLISMQNPITTLKHKFMYDSKTFREINDRVLSLRPSIDVLILDDEIYLFTMAGEKLFNMERAYKSICEEKVLMIGGSGIISDNEMFSDVARKGHHPRMFVSFNEERYKKLKNTKERKRFAKMFEIPLKNDKFDTSHKDSADKLVKLLCNKGMVDPFEDLPVEVSSARKWK